MMGKARYIKYNDELLAVVIRQDLRTGSSVFFSPGCASLQMGIIKHKKGYREEPHTHKKVKRVIRDVEQFLYVKKGRAGIDFFNEAAKKISTVMIKKGDAILIIGKAHALNTYSDFESVTVKQGPFLGAEYDKEEMLGK